MNIFISGIGGAGLEPLAEIALDAGYSVRGSDINRSLQTDELEKRGVKISYKQTAENLAEIHAESPLNWLIFSSSIPPDSPEILFARENSIRVSKRDEFLAEFIREKNLHLLAIAGTHGKTTTTAMLVWAFRQLEIPVSYSVGATLPFGASGAFDAAAKFFVYEADEYDRNFLNFWPSLSLIVSLDYDHADIYPTREKYYEAFRQFIDQSGGTILWQSAAEQLDLEKTDENSTILDGEVSRAEIDLPGEVTRQNAKLVLELLREVLDDFDETKVKKILAKFPGTSRRFEKLADNLFADYAHAPAEIAATLQKAREVAEQTGQKIVAIYQPHQNLRQTEIAKTGGYDDSFALADKIYWAPTYLVRGDLVDGAPDVLSPDDLIETLSDSEKEKTEPIELNEKLWRKIQQHLTDGDLVIVMGAGPIDGWLRGKLSDAPN